MKLTSKQRENALKLISVCQFIGSQGWCPATGGNFSIRLNSSQCFITQSGKDKTQLSIADFMVVNPDNSPANFTLKSSAETALHTTLYQLDKTINCVLHTHSVTSTVLSKNTPENALKIHGFEMQKAISGFASHEDTLEILVFDNTQDIPTLADSLKEKWSVGAIKAPGFLVRGHGLYAWGKSVEETKRHIEGFEFLFNCLWQERLLER